MLEIYPSKFVSLSSTIVGGAAALLTRLAAEPRSVGQLFAAHKEDMPDQTFDAFIDCLTFLFAAGLLEVDQDVLRLAS